MVCRYTSDCRYIYNHWQPLSTIILLFIYQPNTIDIAIALPVDAFAFSPIAISVDPPPTLILMDICSQNTNGILLDEIHTWSHY